MPTAEQFRERFSPTFDDVPDEKIGFALGDAARWVDDSWYEGDYQRAIMFLAAHYLVSEGALDGDGDMPSWAVGPMTSEKLGDASNTWASRAQVTGTTGLDAELATTAYGQRFLAIRRANRGGPIVV